MRSRSSSDLPLALATDFPELPLMEERLSSKFLRDAQAVPLREDDEELALAIADPTDSFVLSAVQMASGSASAPTSPRRTRSTRRSSAFTAAASRRWARSSTPSRRATRSRTGATSST
jgi:hypothetical protein